MARARTLQEKAKAIATTAEWIAGWADWDDRKKRPHPSIRAAIETAYAALQILPESFERNQICAILAAQGGAATAERCEKVRGFIRASKEGDEFSFDPGPGEASDATITAAIEAWARRPGARSRGAPDKWKATAKVLRESGFGVVDPNALRLGWQRRNK